MGWLDAVLGIPQRPGFGLGIGGGGQNYALGPMREMPGYGEQAQFTPHFRGNGRLYHLWQQAQQGGQPFYGAPNDVPTPWVGMPQHPMPKAGAPNPMVPTPYTGAPQPIQPMLNRPPTRGVIRK